MIKTWNFEQKYQNYNKLYERFSTIFFLEFDFCRNFLTRKSSFRDFNNFR